MQVAKTAVLLCAVSVGAAAQQVAPPIAPETRVIGVVIDSIDGGPLTGATVVASGTPGQGTVDSTGRFYIDSVPPGAYEFGVFHPLLDSLGISIATKSLDVRPGLTTTITLATPSGPSVVALFCSEAARQMGAAVVMGRVLRVDSDAPVSDARVRYSWTSFQIGKDIGLKRDTHSREVAVGADGAFRICGLPVGTVGTVRAAHGRAVTGEIPADMRRRPLALVTLHLDTLARGTGVVTGRVVDEHGAIVPRVNVLVAGLGPQVVTNDSGTFAVRDLPSGSQLLQFRKVGFTATDTVLILSAKQPTAIALTLHSAPPQLPTVSVESKRLVALEHAGFYLRRREGFGNFLTAEEVAKRAPILFSDLARSIPGFTISYTSTGQQVIVPGRTGGTNGCILFLVDGQPYGDFPRGAIDGAIKPDQVIGVEFYAAGDAPADLASQAGGVNSSGCALIVVWTTASSLG